MHKTPDTKMDMMRLKMTGCGTDKQYNTKKSNKERLIKNNLYRNLKLLLFVANPPAMQLPR